MDQPTPIRFNEQEKKDLELAGNILQIPKNSWGEVSETVKKSLRFVIEFNDFIWQKFLNDYPPTAREYIKKRLLNG